MEPRRVDKHVPNACWVIWGGIWDRDGEAGGGKVVGTTSCSSTPATYDFTCIERKTGFLQDDVRRQQCRISISHTQYASLTLRARTLLQQSPGVAVPFEGANQFLGHPFSCELHRVSGGPTTTHCGSSFLSSAARPLFT